MKKISVCMLSAFIVLCHLFFSCQEEETNSQQNVGNGDIITLSLGMGGEFISITEKPMTRAEESDNIYGLQIYYSNPHEEDYIPYAYGIFEGGQNITIDFPDNRKYKIQTTVIINGKNRMDITNLEEPFCVDLHNTIYYDNNQTLCGINQSTVALKEGTVKRPDIDRYYGELTEIYPLDYVSKKIQIEAKKVTCGINLEVTGLSGTIYFSLNESETFTLENPANEEIVKLEKLFVLLGEDGFYTKEWFENPIEEAEIEIIWEKEDASTLVLYKKEMLIKRKTEYTFTIDLTQFNNSGDESQIVINLEDNDEEKINIDVLRPATEGTIILSDSIIYLSEINPSQSINLTLKPTNAKWLKIEGNKYIASIDTEEGTGNAKITFSQGTTYDTTTYKFANLSSYEYEGIKVANLLLKVDKDTIAITGEGSLTNNNIIKSLGGDGKWTVVNKSEWITSAYANIKGELTLEAEENIYNETRHGYIIIAHTNDLEYTKTIVVKQYPVSLGYQLFDWIIINYDASQPVYSAFEFSGTGVTAVDYRPVGDKVGNSNFIFFEGDTIMNWSTTNSNYYKSCYIDLKAFDTPGKPLYELVPRYIDIDLYASRVNSTTSNATVNVEISLYKGGYMYKVSSFYQNKNGQQIAKETWKSIKVSSNQGDNTNFREKYNKIATLTYDRIKNTLEVKLLQEEEATN